MISAGSHFLAGFDGYAVTQEVRDLILKDRVLGFTLFKWNIESAEQLIELNRELTDLARQAGYPLVLAVDQEGGRVERLPEPFSRLPSMRRWTALCDQCGSADPIKSLGQILGSEVRFAGFNLDFAPVVDLDLNPQSPIIGDRAFSSDPEIVARYAEAILGEFKNQGIAGCLKHFPGHGATSLDSHLELPTDDRPWQEILASDVVPYRKLLAKGVVPAIMTAHVIYKSFDPDYPATLSQKIVAAFLRGELQYNGIIFSDDFLMQAIADNFDLVKASQRFLEIGGDVVLVCKKPELCREMIQALKQSPLMQNGNQLEKSQKRIAEFLKGISAASPQELPLGQLQRHQHQVNKLFV